MRKRQKHDAHSAATRCRVPKALWLPTLLSLLAIWAPGARICTAAAGLVPAQHGSENMASGADRTARASAVGGFAVTGRLDCTFYRSAGDVFTNQSLRFEVVVDGPKWRVKSFEASGAYWVRGCDGEGVYQLFVDAKEQPVCAALVEPGKVPSDGYPSALPWLAFASADFFSSGEQLPFAPWANPFFEPSVCAYECNTSLSREPPFLPHTIEFFVAAERVSAFEKGRYIKRSGQSPADLNEQRTRVRAEPAGFHGGYYRVTEQTNFGGWLLPARFELVKLRPAVGSRPNSPTAAIYQGTGLSYSTAMLHNALPELGQKPVAVTDLRFRTPSRAIDGLKYFSTNKWETDTNSARLQAAYRERLKASGSFSAGDKRRLVVLGTIALAAIAPVGCFIFGKMRNRRRNEAEMT